MFDHDRPPSPSQLRWFGASLAAVVGVFALIAWWRFSAETVAAVLLALAVALGVVYYAVPRTQQAIIRGFRLLTLPLQVVVSFVVLACLYYLVMTPIGLMLRLLGRDPLAKQPDAEASSYWEPAASAASSSSYFSQY